MRRRLLEFRSEVNMPKKKAARKHRVKAQVHNIDLTKAGSSMLLEVFSEGEKIGTVEIGRGSLRWYGRHRPTPKTIAWSKLADWMDSI
jgi:hypothetical protein